jgi:phosphatidate cytidylyltransferase
MSPFLSRILVAALGLPLVLGLVWLGGWWLWALAVGAGLIALHEFYAMARPRRPLVLAGYTGLVLTLLGAELEGVTWMTGGFLTTLALAFLLKGISETRQSLTIAVATTVLGAGWVGFGLGYLILLRDIPRDGRLAVFTVLLAVFAADTLAYFTGRLIGRHKLAPVISPGKTWEGLVASTAAAILVAFFALYHQGFLTIGEALVLGAVIAIAAPVGDLFESAIKRDFGVKDSGSLLAGHGGLLDRLDAHLFTAVAAYYTILVFA